MYEFKSEDVYRFASSINAKVHRKGDELFFKYCPYCNGGGHDKNTMSVNLVNGQYKCFRNSCGKQGHFVQLARDFGFVLEDMAEKQYKTLPQKKIIIKPKAIEYLNGRGISENTVNKYHITTTTDNDKIIVFPFYDEKNILQFIKYRNIDYSGRGNKEWCEKDTKPILFGMAQCEDFSRLVITEGQIDSLSLAECGVKNAVSVPTGAMGFTWLANVWDWIIKFKEVIVFGDNENGKITLIETLSKRLPMIVKCVKPIDYLCEKDANDILRKYGKDAIIQAVANAEIQDIKYVKRLADVQSVDIMSLPKIKTNIVDIDRAIGGLYYGQVILLSGKRGEGKSTFMSQLVVEALEQNNAVFIYSGELPDYHFKNWLDLQIAGKNHLLCSANEYGDNQYYISSETAKTINDWYRDKAYIFDNSAIQDEEFEGLLEIIKKAICRYNIKFVCLDNLMTALDDDPISDVYRKQSKFIKDLARIAKQFDVVIILVAHPKKSKEEFTNDTVSGSADITNAVDVVMNYERCRPGDSADSQITITKNRLTGRLITGENAVKLEYSEASKRIKSIYELECKEYSCFDTNAEGVCDRTQYELPFVESGGKFVISDGIPEVFKE